MSIVYPPSNCTCMLASLWVKFNFKEIRYINKERRNESNFLYYTESDTVENELLQNDVDHADTTV